MRELWRVTAPNGRLIVVVPRRGGLWARFDNTPFGWGNPYSKSQLERLLRDHSFVPERWRDALYMMPSQRSLMLKSTRFFERAGRLFGPTLAGVIIVSARKELFPAVPRRKRAERYVRVPALAPQAAMEARRRAALGLSLRGGAFLLWSARVFDPVRAHDRPPRSAARHPQDCALCAGEVPGCAGGEGDQALGQRVPAGRVAGGARGAARRPPKTPDIYPEGTSRDPARGAGRGAWARSRAHRLRQRVGRPAAPARAVLSRRRRRGGDEPARLQRLSDHHAWARRPRSSWCPSATIAPMSMRCSRR